MAEAVGLTAKQKQFLDVILSESYFLNNFYLSGGTALSAWYLHHRESYDLDFFTDHPFNYDKIIRWIRQNEHALGYTSVRFEEDYGFLMCFFRFSGKTILKIDFHHYAPATLKKGLVWRGLTIDSLYDISVNKLRTIATIPRTRDYVDVYCLFQHTNYPIQKLMADGAKKFREVIDPLQLAKNFLKVVECTDMPIMLIPFERTAMIAFFQKLAKTLKPQILT